MSHYTALQYTRVQRVRFVIDVTAVLCFSVVSSWALFWSDQHMTSYFERLGIFTISVYCGTCLVESPAWVHRNVLRSCDCFLTRSVLSHDAEQNAVPSGDTWTLLTRFSWPYRIAARVPFNTSHMFIV